ncbi:Kunitz family trypsin and protease inhibitor protein [Striga hermonthica]|uniref:Kunitz family trypsin and protease inhibitor protein n=1 Tax=Striga hermonthica TaxID=68872 RepID=A0A9N7NUS4_STRHE|nr:Kunitz family trypsin and protease inhibitor protein [Striga hermonthica]
MKKISQHYYLLFPILLFTLLSHRAAAQAASPVLDITGQEVQAGVPYHIISAIWGAGGGGLTMSDVRNLTCPLDVTQTPNDLLWGLPVAFHPANYSDEVVRLSTDHNFEFDAVTVCVSSNVWRLAFDNSILRFYITTGGELGNPGRWTLNNWFKIEAQGSNYKLVFCPTVCPTCRPVCGDLTIYVDGPYRRLVMAQTGEGPLTVFFRRAEESASGTVSGSRSE